MHPEVQQQGPGSCPLCGMALEPMEVSAEEEDNPELRSMTRRFWASLALSVPLLVLAMGEIRFPGSGWVQALLATPVVLWAGWPFLVLAVRSFATRRLNTKPVSEGGWNLAHTTNSVPDQGNPLSNPFLVAVGHPASAWGWPTDPKTEELRLKFATAADEASRKAVAAEIQVRAYEQVLYLPLAQFTTPSAWRDNLQGVLKSPVMLLYNIEKK